MADASVGLRRGENRPVYGSASAASGTLTIRGTPTVTLYDADGEVVAGFDGLPVSGRDEAALATVRAWYELDSADLTPGTYYKLTFTIEAEGSDEITRIFRPSVLIFVFPAHD